MTNSKMAYDEIENLFSSLFDELASVLNEANSKELQLFFNAGEYGLAYDTLISIIDNEKVSKSQKMTSEIEKLKALMEI